MRSKKTVKKDSGLCTSRHWGMLGSISSVCPLDCDFCFIKGKPKGLIIDDTPRLKTVREVEKICTEIVHNGRSFDFLEEVGDYLCNKNLLPIIRKFRQYFPDELIDFTTSGVNLSAKNVKQLSQAGFIFLQVSLNSANPKIRRKVMGDPKPQVAIEGIRRLREHNIPFSGTIVGWPTIPEEDIRRTIHYLDAHDPVVIKINLPSYTRFFKGKASFDTFEKWQSLAKLVADVRKEIKTPITWEPFIGLGDPLKPVITGVVKNSPAAKLGLKSDDLIKEVDETPIFFREQARHLLIQQHEQDRHRTIVVERSGETLTFNLRDRDSIRQDRYPHKPAFYPRKDKMFGLFIHQGLDVFALKRLSSIIRQRKSQHTLFLSSFFLAPATRRLIELFKRDLFPKTDVAVVAAKNHFFGGNVMIGDLLVVSDYIRSIRQYIKKHGKPDLIVLPNSAFWNHIDIRGTDYRQINTTLHIPVDLLPIQRIMV